MDHYPDSAAAGPSGTVKPSSKRKGKRQPKRKKGERKSNLCSLCGRYFKYLKDHLMGGKHGLSKDAAAKAVFEMKVTSKAREDCPFVTCMERGVKGQRIDDHLKRVHKLTPRAVREVRSAIREGRNGDLIAKGYAVSAPEGAGEDEGDTPPEEDQDAPAQALQDEPLDGPDDGDGATLERFQNHLVSLDGGSHPLKTAVQYREIVGHMVATTGSITSLLQNPLQMTQEGGFLATAQTDKAPTTVRVYLMALRQFCRFATARHLYAARNLEALLDQIKTWTSSLRRHTKEHQQLRRLVDEARVEDLLVREGEEETPEAQEARDLLSSESLPECVGLSHYVLARNYLVYRTIQGNAQRSGTVVHLTWQQVDGNRLEAGHHVVRTFNKTLGAHGMSNLVFSEEDFKALCQYRKLQEGVLGPNQALVFTTSKENPLQHGYVSQIMQQMTGTRASATLLRKKTVVSWSKRGGDLQSLSRQMRHSTRTQQGCYATFDDRANSVKVYRELQAASGHPCPPTLEVMPPTTQENEVSVKEEIGASDFCFDPSPQVQDYDISFTDDFTASPSNVGSPRKRAVWTAEQEEVLQRQFRGSLESAWLPKKREIRTKIAKCEELRQLGFSDEQVRSKLRILIEKMRNKEADQTCV
jgi:predicted transcriptional regulator